MSVYNCGGTRNFDSINYSGFFILSAVFFFKAMTHFFFPEGKT